MSTISSDADLSNILVARRLMLMERAHREKLSRRGELGVKDKSVLDYYEEDQALLSGEATELARVSNNQAAGGDETRINLHALKQQFAAAQNQPPADNASARAQLTEIVVAQRERTEISVEIKSLAYVEGLVKRDAQNAETDRYAFQFIDGTQFQITDKWSGKSTRVWGDPHVDVSDVEGDRDGEFTDLKRSEMNTSFKLSDGTVVNFTARDNGVIQQVDITKGDQHLRGYGAASNQPEGQQFFSGAVDKPADSTQPPAGDVVAVGGDGNDWYDETGRLIWGKTTGLAPTSRPAYTIELRQSTVLETYAAVRSINVQG